MEATKKLNGKAVGKWLGNNAIIVMMLLVSLIVGIIHPNFFSWNNIVNLFKNVSIRYIIALGISGCLITTGNDLSAGRTAGFAACLACILAQTTGAAGKFYPDMATLPTWLVFVLVIAICAVIGLCNGLVVSFLRVQPFIATLGMQQVVYGICLVYTGGTPIGSLDKSFTSIAIDNFLGIPLLIWVSLIVAVGFWFLYNKTHRNPIVIPVIINSKSTMAQIEAMRSQRQANKNRSAEKDGAKKSAEPKKKATAQKTNARGTTARKSAPKQSASKQDAPKKSAPAKPKAPRRTSAKTTRTKKSEEA